MFKKISYAGFDGHPELRVLAERGTTVLGGVVRDWDVNIEVVWEAYPDHPSGVELTVTLHLPSASGSATRLIPCGEFADPELLESRCRSVWLRAMDAYFEQRKPAWDEIINQPVGV